MLAKGGEWLPHVFLQPVLQNIVPINMHNIHNQTFYLKAETIIEVKKI